MRRRLLIIGGGLEQERAYRLARQRGLEVVGTDRNPKAPALAFADHVLAVSTRDVEATVAAARRFHVEHPLHGVMTVANDVPLTVATTAEALDLPGIPVKAAQLSQDKVAMKIALSSHGVPTPVFREVGDEQEALELMESTGPIVMKPADSCGARGVALVRDRREIAHAFAEAHGLSPTRRVMAEAYVSGIQISSESFLLDSTLHTPALSERCYDQLERFYPRFIENGGTVPAPVSPGMAREIDRILLAAAEALGVNQGSIKGDLVLGPDGPVILELAPRLSGGYFCTHQIPAATGVDLVDVVIDWCLGEPIDAVRLRPSRSRSAVIRYLFPSEGTVRQIEGFEEASRMPGVLHSGLRLRRGDHLVRVKNHPQRAGFVITEGTDRAEAEERARAALSRIHLVMEPE